MPMDGNTKIDCYALQFTQKEASALSEVDMATINNWVHHGHYVLADKGANDGKARRMFSIADIAALHTMLFCVKMVEMRPAAAAEAGRLVYDFFRPSVLGALNLVPTIDDCKSQNGDGGYEVCHILKKSWMGPFSDEGSDVWHAQAVWQERNTKLMYQYNPRIYGDEDPFLPGFPCVLIPTSEISIRIFLSCSDFLLEENGEGCSKE